jgi:hypothetical protein
MQVFDQRGLLCEIGKDGKSEQCYYEDAQVVANDVVVYLDIYLRVAGSRAVPLVRYS